MKKYLFGAAMLLLVGAGCAGPDSSMTSVDGQPEEMNDEIAEEGASGGRVADPIALPSGTYQMYRGEGFALPVDEVFSVQQSGDLPAGGRGEAVRPVPVG